MANRKRRPRLCVVCYTALPVVLKPRIMTCGNVECQEVWVRRETKALVYGGISILRNSMESSVGNYTGSQFRYGRNPAKGG